ncbi:MAG: hypothetical protein ABL928_16150, partial [Sphingorhabdus sp.]
IKKAPKRHGSVETITTDGHLTDRQTYKTRPLRRPGRVAIAYGVTRPDHDQAEVASIGDKLQLV